MRNAFDMGQSEAGGTANPTGLRFDSSGFALALDGATGLVTLRIKGSVDAAEGEQLAQGFATILAEARKRAPALRILWDNREGMIFSSGPLQKLTEQLRDAYQPGDRTAILVSSSLMKVEARTRTNERHAIFLSETAAMTWLNAWR